MRVATTRPESDRSAGIPSRPDAETKRSPGAADRRPLDQPTDWPELDLTAETEELADALKGMYYCG